MKQRLLFSELSDPMKKNGSAPELFFNKIRSGAE